MATEIRMPRLGHSMTEGTLVAWQARPGDPISAGQVVATIETDKAEYEVEAPADGVLSDPLVAETETVPVEAVLGWVLAPGEPRPEATARALASSAPASRQARPATAGRIRASPKARRIARDRGIDLAAVAGSGPDGLVTEDDVVRALRSPGPTEEPAVGDWNGRRIRERRRLIPIRRTTARRLAEAWASVPHIVQMIDVDFEQVRVLRERWRSEDGERAAVSYNDFVVKAAALAMAEHPQVNAAVDGDDLVSFGEVNAGVAVDTERGLLVPVVRNADRRSLLAVSRDARRLAEKARGGALEAGEFGTGTFTVSNLGGFGIRAGTPVLNAPEAMLVFVGAVEERPVVREGTIVPRLTVTLSIAYDHRVADGAAAARVTRRIKDLLESPTPWAEAPDAPSPA